MDMASGNVVQVNFEGTMNLASSRWLVTSHWLLDGAPSSATNIEFLQALSSALHAKWVANITPLTVDDCKLQIVRAKRIHPADSVVALFAGQSTGAVSSYLIEPDSAMVYSIRSDTAGRKGMGRRYIPGVPGLHVADGTVTASDAADWCAALDLVLKTQLTVDTAVCDPVLWSASDSTARDIVYTQVDRILRRQKRRDTKGQLYEGA